MEKYKVRKVSSKVLKDYAGMNDDAARAFGFTPKLKDNEILVDKSMSKRKQLQTVKHEMIEEYLMEKCHYPYWKAHKVATKHENDSEVKIKALMKRYANGKA